MLIQTKMATISSDGVVCRDFNIFILYEWLAFIGTFEKNENLKNPQQPKNLIIFGDIMRIDAIF